MGLGLLLVPALAGYFLQIQLKPFRYRTLRKSGQHLVFRSALTGSILVFVAQLIVHSVSMYVPSSVAFINEVFEFEYSAAAILSFFLLSQSGLYVIYSLARITQSCALRKTMKNSWEYSLRRLSVQADL